MLTDINLYLQYYKNIGLYRLILVNLFVRVVLSLCLTPKQREILEVQFCNWCEKWEEAVQREKSDIVFEFTHGQTWKI